MSPSRVNQVVFWLGVASVVILAFPPLIWIGIALLLIPGVAIWLTPPTFMYCGTALLAWRQLHGLPDRWRRCGTIAALVLLALAPPWLLNASTRRVESELIGGDVSPGKQYASGDTIAILRQSASWIGFNSAANPTGCSELCLRLLYNGAFKRVLMGEAREGDRLDLAGSELKAYRVERRGVCPSDVIPDPTDSNFYWDFHYGEETVARVRARIAAGECLIEEPAGLEEANLVLVLRIVREPPKSDPFLAWSSSLNTVSATRIELLERSAGVLKSAYRLTNVDSLPVVSPFLVSVTVDPIPFAPYSGFIRYFRSLNTFVFPEQSRLIFGPAARLVDNVGTETLRKSFMEAFANPSLPADDPRLRISDQILAAIPRSRSEPSEEELALVRAMLRDTRIAIDADLMGVVNRLGKSGASLAPDLLDRLFAADLPAQHDAVHFLAMSVLSLPDHALAGSLPRLERLAATPNLRGVASVALARLADGGEAEAPFLGSMVANYIHAGGSPRGRDELRAVTGALSGLCALGVEGASQRQVVIDLIVFERARGAEPTPLTQPAMDALAMMGAADEVDRMFAHQQELLDLAYKRWAQIRLNPNLKFDWCR